MTKEQVTEMLAEQTERLIERLCKFDKNISNECKKDYKKEKVHNDR